MTVIDDARIHCQSCGMQMVWQPVPQQHAQAAMQSVGGINDAEAECPRDADKTDPNLYQNLDFYDWLATTNSPSTKR